MSNQENGSRKIKNINGDEPTVPVGASVIDIIKAYNWYSCNCETDDAVKYVLTYLKSKKVSKSTIEKISHINPNKLRNIGWNCRILSNGGHLPDDIHKSFLEKLGTLIDQVKSENNPEQDTVIENTSNVFSIQERIREKTVELIGTLETEIDKFILNGENDFDVAAWFRSQAIKPMLAKKIAEYYQGLYSEVFDALSGKDPELKHSYRRWKKSTLKKYVEFIKTIITVAETNAAVIKVTRKPRKKKAKPAAQVVSKLKFKEKDAELNLSSIVPATIINANQLWVFNTKYRTLTVYNALGVAGLSVKGSSITGFDEKTSITKKLRKPEVTLPKVLESGKVALRKIMDDIKCKSKEASGRINTETVLLRVIK